VREDVIERANGERGIYGVVDKEPSCLVIPLETTAEGEFLYLVSQFRYTVAKRLMEFPQGTWEGSDADPDTVARGELREETGLRADHMTFLASLQIAYGVLNQVQHIYLAEGLTQGEHERDAHGVDRGRERDQRYEGDEQQRTPSEQILPQRSGSLARDAQGIVKVVAIAAQA